VLSSNGGTSAGDQKKRRKKKNKKAARQNSSSPVRSGGDQTVDPIFEAALAKGFTKDEIIQTLNEMFDQGLACDNKLAVITYLEYRNRPAVVVPQPIKGTTQPENVQDSPQLSQSKPKNTNDIRKHLLTIVNTTQGLTEVLDGLKNWYEQAESGARMVAFDEEILFLLFRRVFMDIVQKPDVLATLVNNIKRQLRETMGLLLDVDSGDRQYLDRGINHLMKAALLLRDILVDKSDNEQDLGIEPIARAGAEIVLRHHARHGDDTNGVHTNGVETSEILTVEQGAQEIARVENLMVDLDSNSTGKQNIAQLVSLRDQSKRLVDLSGKCLEISSNDKSGKKKAVPVTKTRSNTIQDLIKQAEFALERSKCATQGAVGGFKTQQLDTQNVHGSYQEKEVNLKSRLVTLHSERERILELLANINKSIEVTSAELKTCQASMSSLNTSEQHSTLEVGMNKALETHKTAQLRLDALENVKRFGDLVSTRVMNETHNIPKYCVSMYSQDPLYEWRTRTIISAERYLSIEVSCARMLQQRVKRSESKISELKGKVENLVKLNMETLAEEARGLLAQERENKLEDERTIISVRKNAQDVCLRVSMIAKTCLNDSNYSLKPEIGSALRRCMSHFESFGFPNYLENVSVPNVPKEGGLTMRSSSPMSVASSSLSSTPSVSTSAASDSSAKPPLVTTRPVTKARGWGSVPKPKASRSFLEIQEEAEQLKKSTPEAGTKAVKLGVTSNQGQEKDTDTELQENNKENTNDAVIGVHCPSLGSLLFPNGSNLDIGKGRVAILAFFAPDEPSDVATLSILSTLRTKYDFPTVEVVGVSLDDELNPDEFLEKYQGMRISELATKGKYKLSETVSIEFPLAIDKSLEFTKKLKQLMNKKDFEHGFTLLLDREGAVRWHGRLLADNNSFDKFEAQLCSVVDDKPCKRTQPQDEAV